MKQIISYNVNGIRSAINKGFLTWLEETMPDIIGIQELKAYPEQFDTAAFEKLGYHCCWNHAQRKGYSGVGLLTKQKPDLVEFGMGIKKYDIEGRVIRTDYDDLTHICVYIPSGSNPERQNIKMEFLADFRQFIKNIMKERQLLIVSGDFNICHKAIDIHNPVRNKNTSGFLPEERTWVDNFESDGFTDSFRFFHPEPHRYSWWSYRANSRAKNLGWRIDYNWISKPLVNKLKSATILPGIVHSDHCPVVVEIR